MPGLADLLGWHLLLWLFPPSPLLRHTAAHAAAAALAGTNGAQRSTTPFDTAALSLLLPLSLSLWLQITRRIPSQVDRTGNEKKGFAVRMEVRGFLG